MSMSSLSRACIELSNSIKGLRLGRSNSTSETTTSGVTNNQTSTQSNQKTSSSTEGTTIAQTDTDTSSSANVTALISPTACKDTMNNIRASDFTNSITRVLKSATNRVRSATFESSKNGNTSIVDHPLLKREMVNPWMDEQFLSYFFLFFTPQERITLAQVCHKWKDILYKENFWTGFAPVYTCKIWNEDDQGRSLFYKSLEVRGFESIVLNGANDSDVSEFVNNFEPSGKRIQTLTLLHSNVTDTGLENLMDKMTGVTKLTLSGCNEITESSLWTCLNARITSLHISDCINIADDSVGAIAQLLPALTSLTLQAYHVTDTSLSFFSAKQSYTLTTLRLLSCWEVTNHGVVNIVRALPNLTVLSLSGCSKVTDDAVELIAENLRQLTHLDLSWCPRITDAALEYIACDLAQLEELVLDRCNHVTDIGVGYLSTMTSLQRLYLRWCTQIRDFGLQHLYTMKNLRVLSLAGCNLLTSSGLSGLTQLSGLQELELTNCQGAAEILRYLRHSLPDCAIIE